MEHLITIALPDEVVQPLSQIARLEGKTLEQIAIERISRSVMRQQPESEKKGDISRFFGIFDSGDPNFADNEKIDADLAREYGATHDDE